MTTSPLMKLVALADGSGTVEEVPYTDEELRQRDLDIAAHTQWQADQATEQTRIDGIKASIAAKRMAAAWQPFTQEETDYLSSVNQ